MMNLYLNDFGGVGKLRVPPIIRGSTVGRRHCRGADRRPDRGSLCGAPFHCDVQLPKAKALQMSPSTRGNSWLAAWQGLSLGRTIPLHKQRAGVVFPLEDSSRARASSVKATFGKRWLAPEKFT